MRRWLNRFWKHNNELDVEAELKQSRPKPPDQLVKAIVSRVNPRPAPVVRARARFGVATALTASLVAVLGATGGLGVAASGVSNLAGGGPVHSTSGPSAATQYAVTPTISGVSPTSGKAGSSITVTGTNFTGASAIDSATVNGHDADFTVTGSTSLTLTIPATESAGVASIVVSNAAGDSNANTDFTVLGTPVITSFLPTHAGTGEVIAINGSQLTGTSKVTFKGKIGTIQDVTDTQVLVTVPAAVATSTQVVPVAVTNPVTTTTNSTDFTYDFGGPTVTTFNPTSGIPGTTHNVVINGTNLNHSLDIYFGTDVGSDTSHGKVTVDNSAGSATSVTVPTVPTGSVTGPITVDNGTGVASTKTSFTVIGTPSVTSFTPMSGVKGTTLVTITGSSFLGATKVTFGTGDQTTVTVKSNTQVTAKVPLTATSGHITVTNGVGTSAASTDVFNVDAPSGLAVDSPSPAEGAAGTPVVISGVHLSGTTKVTFNGKVASFTVPAHSDTEIDTSVPVGAPATGAGIVVTNGAGNSDPLAFTVLTGAPTLTTFSPANGVIGTTSVTINGTNLNHSLDIYFGTDLGSVAGKATVDNSAGSATSVTVTVPAGAETGKITVDNGLGVATTTKSFVIYGAPSIVAFSPASGKSGTKVTIYGNQFDGVVEVDFGGVPATAAPVIKTVTGVPGITESISIATPTNAATGPITVHNPAASADTGGDVFTVIVKPTLDASPFSPTSGLVGDSVTITGSGFTGVSEVKFGSKTADFTVDTDTQITATVPVGATTGKVSVKNAAGVATSGPTFGVIVAPTAVSSFLPTSGAVGATITITGTHLSGAELAGGSVEFEPGDIALTNVTLLSDTKLTADVAVGTANGTYTVKVTNSAGNKTSTKTFAVATPPAITSLGVAHGAVGSMLTITGTNLSKATGVTFGIGNPNGDTVTVKPASTTADGTTLTVKVPPMALSGKITVTNLGVESNQSTPFTVDYVKPVVSSFLPTKAAVGATVKITGSKFTGVQDAGGSVSFNGHAATSVTVNSDTSITAVVPAGATTGPISVTNSADTGTSGTKAFTVLATPTITGYDGSSPTSVVYKKSATIKLVGTNLVTPATVTFTNGSVTLTASATVASNGLSLTVKSPVKLYIDSWTVTVSTAGVTAGGSVSFAVHA